MGLHLVHCALLLDIVAACDVRSTLRLAATCRALRTHILLGASHVWRRKLLLLGAAVLRLPLLRLPRLQPRACTPVHELVDLASRLEPPPPPVLRQPPLGPSPSNADGAARSLPSAVFECVVAARGALPPLSPTPSPNPLAAANTWRTSRHILHVDSQTVRVIPCHFPTRTGVIRSSSPTPPSEHRHHRFFDLQTGFSHRLTGAADFDLYEAFVVDGTDLLIDPPPRTGWSRPRDEYRSFRFSVLRWDDAAADLCEVPCLSASLTAAVASAIGIAAESFRELYDVRFATAHGCLCVAVIGFVRDDEEEDTNGEYMERSVRLVLCPDTARGRFDVLSATPHPPGLYITAMDGSGNALCGGGVGATDSAEVYVAERVPPAFRLVPPDGGGGGGDDDNALAAARSPHPWIIGSTRVAAVSAWDAAAVPTEVAVYCLTQPLAPSQSAEVGGDERGGGTTTLAPTLFKLPPCFGVGSTNQPIRSLCAMQADDTRLFGSHHPPERHAEIRRHRETAPHFATVDLVRGRVYTHRVADSVAWFDLAVVVEDAWTSAESAVTVRRETCFLVTMDEANEAPAASSLLAANEL